MESLYLSHLQEFEGRVEVLSYEENISEYWTFLSSVDICLDSYPYTGFQTTLDALYMNVPVVSFYGDAGYTRQGKAILETLECSDLTVNNEEKYVVLVGSLINDMPKEYQNLRNKLEDSPYLKHAEFTKDYETMFEELN